MVTLNIDRLPFFSYVEPPKGFHRLRNVSGASLCGVTLSIDTLETHFYNILSIYAKRHFRETVPINFALF